MVASFLLLLFPCVSGELVFCAVKKWNGEGGVKQHYYYYYFVVWSFVTLSRSFSK